MAEDKAKDEAIQAALKEIIKQAGGDPGSYQGDLIRQMMETSLKVIDDGHDLGQVKLMTRALKEIRYAYRIFNQYPGRKRVSIFGSARTPREHPDYQAAKAFSAALADHGWMSITGAAEGIMRAGHEGPTRDSSFGLSIRLPFESAANSVIEGDPKLISFRYFFTRKLMFLSHSDAVAVFPGGFGTQDELFEVLTLMQTGKANIIPVVLMAGEGGVYWDYWYLYVKKNLLANGWISPEDTSFFFLASTVSEGVEHVLHFYKRYHSYRYVGDKLVIRLQSPLTLEQVEVLNEMFPMLLLTGKMELGKALPGEEDHLQLPRLILHHDRHRFGLLRGLINQINNF